MSDHYPAQSMVSCGRPGRPGKERKFHHQDITEEPLSELDERPGEELKQAELVLAQYYARRNATHSSAKSERIMRNLLSLTHRVSSTSRIGSPSRFS